MKYYHKIFILRHGNLYFKLPARSVAKWGDNSSGAIAIEFALIFPVLVIMAIGTYDISTVIRQKLELQNATRVGAQYGMVRRPVQGDMQHVITAVRRTLPPLWRDASSPTAAQVNASLQCECSSGVVISCGSRCTSGQRKLTFLKVDIVKTYQTLLPYPGLETSFTISDESIVRLQ